MVGCDTEVPQLQDDCDVQATNISLHGLSPDVFALVNHQEAAKDIWDRVNLLMKGTKLSYQEHECRLYNLFDKFAYVQGETLYEYYWRFSQLINDMHTIGMTMQQVQVNIKFLNALPPEWSKFVTDVKLAKSSSLYPPPQQFTPVYAAPIHHQHHHTPVNPQQQSVSPQPFTSLPVTLQSQAEFPQLDYVLVVPTFQEGEDLIDCINKAMAFLSLVASRPRSSTLFKEKLMLAKAQEVAFQTEDLDAYDLDYDDISSAKAVLMENLSSCDLDVLSDFVQIVLWYLDFGCSKFKVSAIVKEHTVIYVIDDEETLILEEESRSKMLDKQNDPIFIKQKISISPIDYSKLNKIKEDFGKHFVTKKELSAEQAFWLKPSNYNPGTSVKSHKPVRIEAPSELPKVSLVNESLKKIKYQLASFDKVMKKRTTSDAITADKNAFKIQIKQLSIDNDQLLKQIMSQEIVHIAVNSVDILDVKKSCVNECNKCLELETELIKKKDLIEKDVYDKLLKTLKNELRKLKGKNVVDTAVSKPSATIAPRMFKLDIEPISCRLKNNRDAHDVYLEKTIENTDTLRGIVECARKTGILVTFI
ncbi:hypothetical protein Tco_0564540 [Tanacetum coccineum]